MDYYRVLVSMAVKRHMRQFGVSADVMAAAIGVSTASFYAKLSRARKWQLDDVLALAQAGVSIPRIPVKELSK